MEEIVAGWNAALSKQSQSFVKHAQALASWDTAILRTRHSLLNLEQEVGPATPSSPSLSSPLPLCPYADKAGDVMNVLSAMFTLGCTESTRMF